MAAQTTPLESAESRAASPRRRRWWVSVNVMLRVFSVVLFLSVWHAATALGWVSPLFLPSPGQVAFEAGKLLSTGELLESALISSRRVFIGFALAALVGIPMGVVMGVWERAKAFFDPVVSLLRPLPSLTWIPLTMLWFGIGETQKYAIVFMGSVIYILLYTLESTKEVDPILVRAARNLGASDVAVMREVILPGAFPGILAGLKVTLAISWTCVLSAELVAAYKGLGALIWFGKDWNNLAIVLVGMVSISITVLLIDTAVGLLEHRLIPWRRHRRT